ncbi:DcaP family trimeric outer membrane transporter [Rhodoligotrophos defluvii]|uniref:DcaP family trimeric outer membrane transporter n=1 Tax=Rhodoligotrophos defluvii TaxID=2561934 RepID=UPI0010C9B706|nr:DcaP family trimeric outer membrane transporter [Rhodoligotrophos defluvii]
MRTKGLGQSLLAGIALTAMASAGHADELAALKAQLEQLQARVDQLEAQPSLPVVSEGTSWITFRRGTEATADWRVGRLRDDIPTTGGMTISITPTADLPAPVHEVTVAGYVKGDVIYDFDEDLGDFFSYTAITGRENQEHVRLHARQTRFNIKSKSDTAIGQIRTVIEGDFLSGGSFGNTDFRLRYAWGEWDFMPNWTFGAGRYDTNFMSPFTGTTTVDFNGDVGLIGTSRTDQVRVTYTTGPMLFALAVENPLGDAGDLIDQGGEAFVAAFNSSNNVPNFTARWQYDAPGGHQFLVSGVVQNYHTDSELGGESESAVGWGVQGAVNINLADVALLTTSVMYGDGIGSFLFGNTIGAYVDIDGDIHTTEALGLYAGISFELTDATSLNLSWGYADMKKSEVLRANANNTTIDVMSAHANILWQPVEQLRLGWEVMWADRKFLEVDGPVSDIEKADVWRAQFGAWFYF